MLRHHGKENSTYIVLGHSLLDVDGYVGTVVGVDKMIFFRCGAKGSQISSCVSSAMIECSRRYEFSLPIDCCVVTPALGFVICLALRSLVAVCIYDMVGG